MNIQEEEYWGQMKKTVWKAKSMHNVNTGGTEIQGEQA